MKKFLSIVAVMMGLITASCSQDEPAVSLPDAANNMIGFSVTADNGSRSTSHYENGTDISEISVSAWVTPDANTLPGYHESNTGNSVYFFNDVLRRDGSGVFNYSEAARFWPADAILDFYSVIDNPTPFTFDCGEGYPGLDGWIAQGKIEEMPDMLYAYAFDEKRKEKQKESQQNVSLKYNHAFAKVVVTAEVRNPNLRVYITDMEIHGVTDKGKFLLPHKVGQDKEIKVIEANWKKSPDYTNITGLMKTYNTANPAILDMAAGQEAKRTLLGEEFPNDLLVIPNTYNGRNSSKCQTYILLKGYAYNISNRENGFDPDIDELIYPKTTNGKVEAAPMIIPIEFHWGMGTINYYNIVFDCGGGGNMNEDPNNPALVRIGYEVEVNDWTTGEQKNEHVENGENVDHSIEYYF